MKPFEQQDYYEILDIKPDVLPFEIRKAYKAALELYSSDSIATYSFFSEEERNKIISRLKEAFNALIDHQSRSEYDKGLIMAGELEECSRYKKNSPRPVQLLDSKSSRGSKSGISADLKPTKPRPAPTQKVIAILAQNVLTGNDLKSIRAELGLSLEEITQKTKIRPYLLRAIEEDQFDKLPSRFHLKSFLHSHAQCLCEEPQAVVAKYMKRINP
jgi:curved DNA-binding protein CbpA